MEPVYIDDPAPRPHAPGFVHFSEPMAAVGKLRWTVLVRSECTSATRIVHFCAVFMRCSTNQHVGARPESRKPWKRPPGGWSGSVSA